MASSKSLAKRTHSEQWWANNAPAGLVRCTAHYKSTGGQCRRDAAPGTNVCDQHGALIPAVQAKAAARLQMSADDAAQALRRLAFDEKGDPRVRLNAIKDLLDRGGLGVTSKVLVGIGTVDPVEKLFSSLLSDPAMLAAPGPPPPLDPEYAAYNVLDDDEVVRGEVVRTDSPALSAAQPDEPPEAVEGGSSRPPKHILDDLEALGLL